MAQLEIIVIRCWWRCGLFRVSWIMPSLQDFYNKAKTDILLCSLAISASCDEVFRRTGMWPISDRLMFGGPVFLEHISIQIFFRNRVFDYYCDSYIEC